MKKSVCAALIMLVAPVCGAEWDVYKPAFVTAEASRVILTTLSSDGDARLVVTCDPDLRDAGAPLVVHLVAKDDAVSGSVDVRFDAGPASREVWPYDDDYFALDAEDAEAFIDRMVQHARLQVSVKTSTGAQTARFDIGGLEREMETVPICMAKTNS